MMPSPSRSARSWGTPRSARPGREFRARCDEEIAIADAVRFSGLPHLVDGAALVGVAGGLLARNGQLVRVVGLGACVTADRHAAYTGDLWAHLASYGVGFVGSIVLAERTWRDRR